MVRYKGNLSTEYIEEDKYSDKTLWASVSHRRRKVLILLLLIAVLLFTVLMFRTAHAGEISKEEIAEMIEMSIVLKPWEDTKVIFADRSFGVAPSGSFIVFIGRRLPGSSLAFHGEVIKDK